MSKNALFDFFIHLLLKQNIGRKTFFSLIMWRYIIWATLYATFKFGLLLNLFDIMASIR